MLEGTAWQPCTGSWNTGLSCHLGTPIVVEVEGSHVGGEETASVLGLPSFSSLWGQIPGELSCETGTGHGYISGHLWAEGMNPNWERHCDEQGSEVQILARGG